MRDEDLYRKNVDSRLGPVAKKILHSGFPFFYEWDAVKISAALHYYVAEKVSYEPRGRSPVRRRFRPPTECWEKGGNCEEQSVLLASLFGSVRGVESRWVSVRKRGGGGDHLLVFAGYRLDSKGVEQRLKDFYDGSENFDKSYRNGFAWQNRDGVSWFFADPEFSSYIGDYGSLERDDYLWMLSDSNWEWWDKNYEYKV